MTPVKGCAISVPPVEHPDVGAHCKVMSGGKLHDGRIAASGTIRAQSNVHGS